MNSNSGAAWRCGALAVFALIVLSISTLIPYGIHAITGILLLFIAVGLINPGLLRLQSRTAVLWALEVGVAALATAMVSPLLILVLLDILAAIVTGELLRGVGEVRDLAFVFALLIGLVGLWSSLISPDRAVAKGDAPYWLVIAGLAVFALIWVYLQLKMDGEGLIGGRVTYWFVLLAPLAVAAHRFFGLAMWKLHAGESDRSHRI